ncbi:hypothetical protein ACFWIA_32795 [Streptomyces sp. NPDC127068]|uniref:hypothetical protein n=1 Tax=Streptomyces sp. NPDC127068 TaxID=3347127 RepID=UPI003656BF54
MSRTPHDIVSELGDRKIDVIFAHACDTSSGLLELADLATLCARTLVHLGEPLDSRKSGEAFRSIQGFYNRISLVTGWSPDRKVTLLEWRAALVKAMPGGVGDYKIYLEPVGKAIWAAADKDDDGFVRLDEFMAYHRSVKTSPANIEIAAKKLGLCGNDARLPTERIMRAHQEFCTSTDPEAPGNWFYGNIWAKEFWDGTRARL